MPKPGRYQALEASEPNKLQHENGVIPGLRSPWRLLDLWNQ